MMFFIIIWLIALSFSDLISDDVKPVSVSFQAPTAPSKKKLVATLRNFEQYQHGLSGATLSARMQTYQKKSAAELQAILQDDPEFVQLQKVLDAYKLILTQCKGYSAQDAQVEINIASKQTLPNILQSYYAVVGTLSKAQMFDLMKSQIEHALGFSPQDAQQEIDGLSSQSLSMIKDRCMQYQYVLIGQEDVSENSTLSQAARLQQMQKQYEAAQSMVAKLPIVKNIAALLPTVVIDATSQQLYTKIAQAMKNAGFQAEDVDAEIARLKSLSLLDLQQEFATLHGQLINKLYYFQGPVDQATSFKKNLDFAMQQLHQWGSTAALVAASGAQAIGYDSSALTLIGSSLLFDPNLTFSKAINKKNLLEMIYLQYEGFSQLRDHFINVDFKPTTISSKAQLLAQIHEQLIALGIDGPMRSKYMDSYQNMAKSDLEDLCSDMGLHTMQENRPALSEIEQHALTMSKQELLENIKIGLQYLQVPGQTIEQTMTELEGLNSTLLKAAYIDTAQAMGKPQNLGKVPQFFSKQERILMSAPKAVVTALSSHITPDPTRSELYQRLKSVGIAQHLQEKPETTPDNMMHFAQAATTMRSMAQSVSSVYDTARVALGM